MPTTIQDLKVDVSKLSISIENGFSGILSRLDQTNEKINLKDEALRVMIAHEIELSKMQKEAILDDIEDLKSFKKSIEKKERVLTYSVFSFLISSIIALGAYFWNNTIGTILK